jgi:hypothetical protein
MQEAGVSGNVARMGMVKNVFGILESIRLMPKKKKVVACLTFHWITRGGEIVFRIMSCGRTEGVQYWLMTVFSVGLCR